MCAPGETYCPGCGLVMPVSDTVVYEGYYDTEEFVNRHLVLD